MKKKEDRTKPVPKFTVETKGGNVCEGTWKRQTPLMTIVAMVVVIRLDYVTLLMLDHFQSPKMVVSIEFNLISC